MKAELERIERELQRAENDLAVDDRRSIQAYFRKDVKNGRFYGQEARRDALVINRISNRISYLKRLERARG